MLFCTVRKHRVNSKPGVTRSLAYTCLYLINFNQWCCNPAQPLARATFYLAVRRGFSAGAGRGLSLHFRSCLRYTNPYKVDDVVQIGEEVGAREPAVVAVLLDARLL